MAELLPVPEVAAGATEVIVAEWLVAVGAEFQAGDAIAVIETEKAIVEIEAEQDSVLLRALVEPGTTIDVGAPMALLGTLAELDADLDALLGGLGVDGPAAPDASKSEVPPSEAESPAPGQDPAPLEQPPGAGHDAGEERTSHTNPRRVFISPIARKLLKDAGLPVDGIEASGPGGRIRRRDVEAAIAARPTVIPDTTDRFTAARVEEPTEPVSQARSHESVIEHPGGAWWTEVEHSRLRRAVARRLTQSKQEVPHFYVKRTAVLEDLLALRAQLNELGTHRVSVNDFLIRAIAVAHTKIPEANVVWTNDAMRQFDGVDVAVAIASERGLVTPVLRGVENMTLSGISSQVKNLVERANAGRLQQRDLEGGSITISNLGMYGVDEFSAIINPPQSAILAVGAGRPTPSVVGDTVQVRTAVQLVVSVDHRAIDGALAAQWMDALVTAIESPLSLVV